MARNQQGNRELMLTVPGAVSGYDRRILCSLDSAYRARHAVKLASGFRQGQASVVAVEQADAQNHPRDRTRRLADVLEAIGLWRGWYSCHAPRLGKKRRSVEIGDLSPDGRLCMPFIV